jgi:hypothetical protein
VRGRLIAELVAAMIRAEESDELEFDPVGS